MIRLLQKDTSEEIEFGRLVGTHGGELPGNTVIFVGGMHGNEPAGVFAISHVLDELRNRNIPFRGKFYGIAGNLPALSSGVRFIEADLNRIWAPNGQMNNRPAESHERSEIIEIFEQILEETDKPITVFDLHTTSADSVPFIAIGDTLRNRSLASKFPVPIVLGLEEHMKGTLFSFLSRSGISSVIFEAGQHDDISSIKNHITFIWQALLIHGCLDLKYVPKIPKLLSRSFEANIMETVYRYGLEEHDEFEVVPGFQNFTPITKSTKIADHNGAPVYFPSKGRIFLPLYQKQGKDGFFIVQKVSKFWLFLSAVIRRLKIDRKVHHFPGVSHHPEMKSAYIINRGVAKIFALQIFHLLGFRLEKAHNSKIIVKRREFDFAPPDNSTILKRIQSVKDSLP